MHFAVVYAYTNIASIRTSERTLFHAIHKTFYDGRDETCINSTPYNAIANDQFTTPSQRNFLSVAYIHLEFLITETVCVGSRHSFCIRFYDEMNFAKLSCASRLFFMTVIGSCRFCNSFAIRYFRFFKNNGKLIVVFHTPF